MTEMRRGCKCFEEFYRHEEYIHGIEVETQKEYDQLMNETSFWKSKHFHSESKSTTKRAWDVVCEIINDAEQKNTVEINLSQLMDREDYYSLNTLPASIGNLKALKKLVIYGSNISSIPREISGCESLREFTPYQSHRLHWLPYEIRRCKNLTESTISTRVLYGNYKTRSPFPNLKDEKWIWNTDNDLCSVCEKRSQTVEQYWITDKVATDIVPLLVSVCGVTCLSKVGDHLFEDYIPYPHQGGLTVLQPQILF